MTRALLLTVALVLGACRPPSTAPESPAEVRGSVLQDRARGLWLYEAHDLGPTGLPALAALRLDGRGLVVAEFAGKLPPLDRLEFVVWLSDADRGAVQLCEGLRQDGAQRLVFGRGEWICGEPGPVQTISLTAYLVDAGGILRGIDDYTAEAAPAALAGR